jgi:polysaccharide export outer membrane protein
MKKIIIPLLLVMVSFGSCITSKQLVMFPEDTGSTQSNYPLEDYKLRPNDLLSVSMHTLDEHSTTQAFMNRQLGSVTAANMNQLMAYLRGVMVELDGTINLPLVGSVPVSGLSVSEVRKELNKRLAEVSDSLSFFEVRLLNYRVTVIGEVKVAGTYYFYEKGVTLLQAISQTGGLTDLANMKRVKVTRETPKGIVSTYLDISKPEVVSSEFFFLRPNDVIYIEPLKIKALRLNSQALTLTLSLITLSLAVYNLIERRR